MLYFFYILVAVFMFGVLITVHELGHFIAAKASGVRVNEFAIGMGPKLFSRERGETLYTLRALPIGGFCAMEGEDGEGDDPRSLPAAAGWKQFLILIAGSVMNFLAGVLIFLLLFLPAKSVDEPVVATVTPDSPAYGVLQEGDRLLSVDGHHIFLPGNARLFINYANGAAVRVEVARGGERLAFTLQPVRSSGGLWAIGIEMRRVPANLLTNLRSSFLSAADSVRTVFFGLGELLGGRAGLGDLSGPIGIVSTVGEIGTASETVGLGLLNVLNFMALIAVNLAVMNLLPVPALDGGRILFLGIDAVYHRLTRRRLNQRVLGYINAAGLFCLLALIAVVAVSDVRKLI